MQKTKEYELRAGRVEQAKKSKTLSGLRSGSKRGSSVNFKKITSAIHSVTHASREAPPDYLLQDDKSQGAHVIIDDNGEVASRLEHKLSLASRQAKATKDYSPLWEGVINMPEPSSEYPAEKQKEMVLEWCKRYEAMTGHQVLRADLHLDEGHIDDHGEARLNAHAHVMLDRTDDKGRVIKLSAPKLREIQTMTAEVTGLARGENSLRSGRKHIEHQAFRYMAERGRLDPNHAKAKHEEAAPPVAESMADRVKRALEPSTDYLTAERDAYKAERDALKASGTATQKAYQDLKAAHEITISNLKTQTERADKMDKELTDVKAKYAAMAEDYEAFKAKGGNPVLYVPSAKPAESAPYTPTPEELENERLLHWGDQLVTERERAEDEAARAKAEEEARQRQDKGQEFGRDR